MVDGGACAFDRREEAGELRAIGAGPLWRHARCANESFCHHSPAALWTCGGAGHCTSEYGEHSAARAWLPPITHARAMAAALQKLTAAVKASLAEGAAYQGTLKQFAAHYELRYDIGPQLTTVRDPCPPTPTIRNTPTHLALLGVARCRRRWCRHAQSWGGATVPCSTAARARCAALPHVCVRVAPHGQGLSLACNTRARRCRRALFSAQGLLRSTGA